MLLLREGPASPELRASAIALSTQRGSVVLFIICILIFQTLKTRLQVFLFARIKRTLCQTVKIFPCFSFGETSSCAPERADSGRKCCLLGPSLEITREDSAHLIPHCCFPSTLLFSGLFPVMLSHHLPALVPAWCQVGSARKIIGELTRVQIKPKQ